METFCEKKSGKNLQGKNYRGVATPPGCIRVNLHAAHNSHLRVYQERASGALRTQLRILSNASLDTVNSSGCDYVISNPVLELDYKSFSDI